MASSTKQSVIPQPLVLPPASPTELLTYVINHCFHPTTVLVGCPRQDFVAALTRHVLPLADSVIDLENPGTVESQPHPSHPLLQQTLLQIAVMRHIRIVFTPSVTHFRAWTAVFSPFDSKIPAPPSPQSSGSPVLLAYGFVDLHRDTSEWSAQGLAASAATLIEAATRYGFRAIVMEPKPELKDGGGDEQDATAEEFGHEKLPMLKGISMKEDGTWVGRTIELRQILSRWFKSQGHGDQET